MVNSLPIVKVGSKTSTANPTPTPSFISIRARVLAFLQIRLLASGNIIVPVGPHVALLGIVTVPVNVGDAMLAFNANPAAVKAVDATWVVLVPGAAVGTAGIPVKVGEASGANDVATKAVDASWVVLVPGAAVGAAGVPVNVGEASGAFNPSAVLRSVWLESVPTIVPQAAAPGEPATIVHIV